MVCARLGDRALPLIIDLLKPESCASLLSGVFAKTGRLDILHANAGTYIGGDLTETNHDAIEY
jgi:ribitol 2-dehydrogenase